MQAIDVHREFKNCMGTFWVMSQFLHFLGASRGCADFRDPTAVFRLNLETAVGCKKDAYGMGVHGEIKKFVVTLGVMRHFFIVRGAPRACVDFCDPTAVSRLNLS